MPSIDWYDIAEKCGSLIESIRRGVLTLSNRGVYAVYVPHTDRARLEGELEHQFIPIQGFALHIMDDGEQIFVAVVKCENVDKLRP